MAKVESLRCPNCGGTVSGKGEITCQYCGSKLSITQQGSSGEDFSIGFSRRTDAIGYFAALSGVPIKHDTTEIPFKPDVTYSRLRGGQPDTRMRLSAESIVSTVNKLQEGVNKEDINEYMNVVSKSGSFYETEKARTLTMFAAGDVKRFATALDFSKLSSNLAEVTVAYELITFTSAGTAQNTSLNYTYKIVYESGRWLVASSTITTSSSKTSTSGAKKGKGIFNIGCFIASIIGLSVGLPLVLTVPQEIYQGLSWEKQVAIDEFFKPSDNYESTGRTVKVESYGMQLYSEPTTLSDSTEYVNEGAQLLVVEVRDDYWVHLRLITGDEGWTRGIIHGEKIEEIDGEATCPSYDVTGQQNNVAVGKVFMIGQHSITFYSRPSVGSDTVGSAYKGEKIEVLEAGSDFWVKVRSENNEIGWARCSFVGNHVNGKSY